MSISWRIAVPLFYFAFTARNSSMIFKDNDNIVFIKLHPNFQGRGDAGLVYRLLRGCSVVLSLLAGRSRSECHPQVFLACKAFY